MIFDTCFCVKEHINKKIKPMNHLFDLGTFFKFLSKNKLYTFIDIFGLSVSLMFVILIAVYTVQELSVDSFQEKAERVYILGNEKNLGSAYRLAARLKDRYPEIERACPVATAPHQFAKMPVMVADTRHSADLMFSDTSFFHVFSFPLVAGDRGRVLEAKNGAVISETFARKAFPGADPIGQQIRVQDSVVLTVTGVMKDIRNSAIPYADILIEIDNIRYFNSAMAAESFDNYGSTFVFMLAHPGADLRAKADDMAAYLKEIVWIYQRGMYEKVILMPLREIYFSSYDSFGTIKSGDRAFVLILLSAGVLILVFAVTNYVNLTVAQSGFRAREMAMRRLLGSERRELFLRLMMESTLLCFLSFLAALLLTYLLAPYAGDLLETRLDLSAIISPVGIGAAFVTVLLTGIVAGLMPALIISNAKPMDVVKGSFRTKTKMTFSKCFITFQNAITIALIAASLTMALQTGHLIHAPLGFNTRNLIDIPFLYSSADVREQNRALGDEISQLAGVKRIAFCRGTPIDGGNNHSVEYDGKNLSLQVISGDSVYADMLGLQILRDHQSANSDAYYFSEQAIRELGIPEDAPSVTFKNGWTVHNAGVMQDIRLRNILFEPRPVLLRMREQDPNGAWSLLVEVQGDPGVAFAQVREAYERITRLDFNGRFADDIIAENFAGQKRMALIVNIFAGVALLISLLGLLAMSTYFIRRRAREIAVRKVFGSSNPENLQRLISTFLSYVVIAFVLTVPVVWYLMRQWLDGYSYRIPLSPWIFVGAGMFCLLVSFVTVFFQSRTAANANPVKRLKSE
jgi:putative ABC transport system permease protein